MNTRVHPFPQNKDFGPKIRHELAEKIFDDLREMSIDGPGVSRATYVHWLHVVNMSFADGDHLSR